MMCSHADLFNAMCAHINPFQTPFSLWTSQPWPISKHDDSVCLTKWVEVQFVAPDLSITFIYTTILKNFHFTTIAL